MPILPMKSLSCITWLLFPQAITSIATLPLGWGPAWKTEDFINVDNDCRTSHVTRYEMARKRHPVHFSTDPLDDFEWPRIEPMNSTAGEQWEFDGISEDGTEAFCFGFYRDPNYSFLGTGNLRAYVEFGFANGSRYAVVDYAEQSTIVSCPGRGTRGVWSGDGWSYTFETSADMSRTRIIMDNPEAKGTVVMTSITKPRYANNVQWPSATGELSTVPHFYWAEPVPVADAYMEGVIKGDLVGWSGIGGHERLWGAFNWYTCLEGMTAVRLRVGPYALSFVQFSSGMQRGLQIPAVVLAKHGQTILTTKLLEDSSEHDHAIIRKIYGDFGVSTSRLQDKATGFDILLGSPSRDKQWRFIVTHKNVGFEYFLGQGAGGTAYSGTAEGGETGEGSFSGPVFSEIMKFPDRSLLLTTNYVS